MLLRTIICALLLAAPAADAAAGTGRTRPVIPMENLADTTSLHDVYERCIEASGGREALRALDTRVLTARLVTDLAWDPPVHEVDTLVAYVKAPDAYLIVHRSAKGTWVEGSSEEGHWKREVDGSVVETAGPDPFIGWLTDVRFPANLDAAFPEAELVGIDVIDNRHFYVVAVDDRPVHNLYFDVETGRLARLGFHHVLEDFVATDGALFPGRVVHSRKGGSDVFEIESVHQNIPLDDVLFEPPAALD
ncbi:MAG: hypothetical protein GF405_02180 [Candidatus Eisenbacteria bacterium]|nr:hypothetical protein [Candidatus Eisenbacteria bacterium]